MQTLIEAPETQTAAKRPVCATLPALLGWTDPETGERLELALHGSGEFLSQLLALGFSELSEAAPASVDGAGVSELDG